MNYWIQTGDATADVDLDTEKQTISLSTNLYPDYLIFEGTFREGGPYPTAPEPQPIEQKTLSLIPTNSNYKTAITNSINMGQPTMFDLGFVGRPDTEAVNNAHWSTENKPLEILDLDPLSVEAWDVPAHQARENYDGLLRFNVAGIDKSEDESFDNFTLYDGSKVGLSNDYYGAHTQPGGAYHLHQWKPGEELDHSNKVIGYIYDESSRAFPLMGLGTTIMAPIFDDKNHLIDFDISKPEKRSASGYGIRSDYIQARRSQTPQNGNTDDIPEDAAGIFHIDYSYQGQDKPGFDETSSYLLDAYNMAFVRIDGLIQKAYVQTEDYPYTAHTVYNPIFTAEPTPEPVPEPTPEPVPEPTPEPVPEPTPEPEPEPTPEPEPEPSPEPEEYEPPSTENEIKGTKKDDDLMGTKQSDLITGKKGDDTLTGSKGDDVIRGDKGNDFLKGSKGNDYLDGSKGIDILTGGKGADVFQISKGLDVVKDFSLKQGDKIALLKKGDYTIIDDDDGVLIMATAKKQLYLEGVDYEKFIGEDTNLFVKPNWFL